MWTRIAARSFFAFVASMILLAPSSATATNLFVSNADNFNAGIYEINPAHDVSVFANNGGLVSYTYGLAFDTRGDLYAVSGGSDRTILKFSSTGSQSTYANYPPGQLTGLAFGTGGNLFAADWSNGKIIEISSSGVQTTLCNRVGSSRSV